MDLPCFMQGVKDKEAIATELAAAEAHIAATNFGQILLKRFVLWLAFLSNAPLVCLGWV